MIQHSQAVKEVEETMEVNMEVKRQQEVIKSLETLSKYIGIFIDHSIRATSWLVLMQHLCFTCTERDIAVGIFQCSIHHLKSVT